MSTPYQIGDVVVVSDNVWWLVTEMIGPGFSVRGLSYHIEGRVGRFGPRATYASRIVPDNEIPDDIASALARYVKERIAHG